MWGAHKESYRQKWGWLARRKARYFVVGTIVLFFAIQILSHDTDIYIAVLNGNADSNALGELYFPALSLQLNLQLGRALFGVIAAFIALAIAIKIAQRKVEAIGYSV